MKVLKNIDKNSVAKMIVKAFCKEQGVRAKYSDVSLKSVENWLDDYNEWW